jgi:sugar/nucleoside kinase (ribokinase family)
MADFWVIGPIAWDRVLHVPYLPPSGGFVQATEVAERPGGSGANTAIALASTGASVHMVGYVGDDGPGARLRATLTGAGVDVRFVHGRDGRTSEVIILVEPSGERAICGIRPDLLHTVPVPAECVAPGDVVYFAAWHEEFLPAMAQLTDGGAIVATVPPPVLAPGLPVAYVIGSQAQYESQEPRSIVRGEEGPVRVVVVTRGVEGLIVHDRGGSVAYPAHQVAAVDTTGAGDAFVAGFLYQVVVGAGVDHAVSVGTAWAGATVQSASSIPPPWQVVRDSVRDLPWTRLPNSG